MPARSGKAPAAASQHGSVRHQLPIDHCSRRPSHRFVDAYMLRRRLTGKQKTSVSEPVPSKPAEKGGAPTAGNAEQFARNDSATHPIAPSVGPATPAPSQSGSVSSASAATSAIDSTTPAGRDKAVANLRHAWLGANRRHHRGQARSVQAQVTRIAFTCWRATCKGTFCASTDSSNRVRSRKRGRNIAKRFQLSASCASFMEEHPR